jgi:hypothetical protein
MPKPTNIFSHLCIAMASRKLKCDRKRAHSIMAGEYYLAVKGRKATRTYCRQCAREVLAFAGSQLSELRTLLENDSNLFLAGLYNDEGDVKDGKKRHPPPMAGRISRSLE